jgi:hypothetical protein
MSKNLLISLCLSVAALFAVAACGGDDDDGGDGGGGGDGASTNYPAAGEDVFSNTHAVIEIEITQEGAAGAGAPLLIQTETVELDGPARVTRSDPRQDGDVFVVDTEIVEMELRGEGSFGPIVVRESPDKESQGEVRQKNAGEDFPADSFFDVYVEVEVTNVTAVAGGLRVNGNAASAAGNALILHNEEPMRMVSELSSLPPSEGERYRGEDERPLYTPAAIQVGRIIDALHIPEPDEDEEPTEEPEATNTSADAATATPGATDTPEAGAGPQTQGGCTHGTGQSVLHMLFTGLEPGETITGIVTQRPQGGLISPENFEATADADGVARVNLDIARFGPYSWIANASSGEIRGNFIVAQECPGEPEP